MILGSQHQMINPTKFQHQIKKHNKIIPKSKHHNQTHAAINIKKHKTTQILTQPKEKLLPEKLRNIEWIKTTKSRSHRNPKIFNPTHSIRKHSKILVL